METLKKIVLFALISTILITCKKETLPPSVVGQPVFSFDGTIGNTPLNLQAGVGNYYMYTSYQDSAGLYSFSGTLKSTSTVNNSIQVIINDYELSASADTVAAHINNSISASASYGYALSGVVTTTKYSVQFMPIIVAGNAQAYTYTFGDSSPDTVSKSNKAVTHTYNTKGIYATKLKVGFSNGSAISSNTINISNTQSPLWIDSITSTQPIPILPDSSKITFMGQISNGTPPYTYIWNFDDNSHTSQSTSNTASNSVTHTYDSVTPQGVYTVTLTVTDKNANTANLTYAVRDEDTISPAENIVNCKISPPTLIKTFGYPLSGITIVYTDINGRIYTSKNTSQPNYSSFKINTVSSYQNNINNAPTKMLNVTFSCMLYNTNSPHDSIQASNCKATIAVAYP